MSGSDAPIALGDLANTENGACNVDELWVH